MPCSLPGAAPGPGQALRREEHAGNSHINQPPVLSVLLGHGVGHWPRQPGRGSTAAGGEELLPSCSGSLKAFVKEGKCITALNHKTKIGFALNDYDASALMSVKRGY